MTSPANPADSDRGALRRALRRRRAALPAGRRLALARRIAAHVARLPELRAGARIGLYVQQGSEVPTSALRQLAAQRGCRIYLPRIVDYRAHRMVFVPAPRTALRPNRHRISEPAGAAAHDVRRLDILFLPLVGFDGMGNRMGSGAGYYDRLLGPLSGTAPGPLRIGLAFECQYCPDLGALPHDVPLDMLISECGVCDFRTTRATLGPKP